MGSPIGGWAKEVSPPAPLVHPMSAMPLYEFECKTCGTRFEKLILGSSRPNPPCPSCDARDVDKLYSAFGVGSSNGRRSGGSSPVTFSGG